MSFEVPESFNLADHLLDARVREGHGERTALRLVDRHLSYRQVQLLANRFGQVLKRLGARQEERVMLALPDGAEMVGALFGALKAGLVPVMVNPQLKPDEIKALYSYTQVRYLIACPSVIERFRAAAHQAPWLRSMISAGAPPSGAEPGGQSFESLSREVDDHLECASTHRDDVALWLFSGGTTGRPKAVLQSHRSFANTTELYAKRTLRYAPADITLSVPKLYFGYATGSNLFFPFSVGASAALYPEHPTAETVFAMIQRFRPTLLISVPTLIQRMVETEGAAEQDLSSLRFVTSAGEALPAALQQRFEAMFGTPLLDGLGTAEMWHVFISNRPDDIKAGTLGRVVEGFDVRVRDEEGRDLDDGEVGRMWVRGGSRAQGYWRNFDKTQEAFRGEWYVSGDLLRRDPDGTFTYCGRDDDVVKVGGKWLVPAEVEACLLRHPRVKECAVVAAADAAGLTKPYAFVLAAQEDESLEEELKQHALAHLQPYKHPRRVVVLESFPRTHLGKIDRGALKKLLSEASI